jgi:peptidoglycan/xylan/chitin deacetylase (PgdA/CDA1 family)
MTPFGIRNGFGVSAPLLLAVGMAWVGASGCSSGDEGGRPATSTGGSSGTGGSVSGSGGSSSGSGGTTSGSGGSGDTGGSVGSGGSEQTGGADGSGGSNGSGGSADVDAGTGGPDADTGGGTSGNGCAGGTCLNPKCEPHTSPQAIGTFPEIGFETKPSYIPNDVVIPTFDDVPDQPYTSADGELYNNFGEGDWTRQMLDFFDANNLHMDFFINVNNFCDVEKTASCKAVVQRILKSHNAANHTMHHIHMGSALPYDADVLSNNGCGAGSDKLSCDDEIQGVSDFLKTLGAQNPLTRFRAPYGEPFQAGGGSLSAMKTVVAKYAVHVGWAMESTDADHDSDHLPGSYFADKVLKAVGSGPGKGSWGVILMHGTYPWSLGEVKILLDPNNAQSLQKRGFRIGTVEDAICWKYGKHSWEIIQQLTGKPQGPN